MSLSNRVESRNSPADGQRTLLGHPTPLYMLFFAEMWERFSYYGMRALLVLYMTKEFLWSDTKAYGVYASYTSLVYATPVFGGLLADRLLGSRKAVTLGGILMALGHFAMAVESHQVFYLALALLICGNGLFKPNISTIVGSLYEPNDPRRDGGFTIFYMGVNLGAGAAPLACGYIGERFGWHWGFTLAGIGMLAGLAVFTMGRSLLGTAGEPPDKEVLDCRLLPGLTTERAIPLGALGCVAVAWFLVQSGEVVGQLLSGLGIVVLASILYYMATRCDQVQRDRLLVVLVLTLFSMVFWSFFEQAGSSINLFTDRNVDRTIWGRETPASIYQSVNPAFILLLAPLFSMLWLHLARAGREPSTPIKFSLGLLQLGLGFGVLYLGASSAVPHGGIVPLGWLIAGYFLHTTGELCLSPVGLSMVTKLSPAHIMGLMMGTWFLATSFSQYIAGLIAKLTGIPIDGGQAGSLPPPSETVMIYGDVFGKIALTAIAASLVALLVAPWLRKRMHGIH